MRWPWKRRTYQPLSEATLARMAAERRLQVIQSETPFYKAQGERMTRYREENHFSALFRAIHQQKG